MSEYGPPPSGGVENIVDGRIDPQGDKSFLVTWLLSLFLGGLGIDRFYLGKTGTAVLKLLTCGGAGIWALIDLIIILAGRMRDRDGRLLRGVDNHTARVVAWIVSALVVLGGGGWGPQVTVNQAPTTYPATSVATLTADPTE